MCQIYACISNCVWDNNNKFEWIESELGIWGEVKDRNYSRYLTI